jgi:hypothetical protein
MKFSRALLACAVLLSASSIRAVYAPIPEQDQGKDLVLSVKGGLSYDSNLFGAANNEIGSAIWELAPRVLYNTSLTDQTFFSAGYGLTLNQFDNRPNDKLLDSHDLTLRVAHAFSQSSNIDITNLFMVSRNPETLLAGIPLNPDQSFSRNQLDGRYVTPLGPKFGFTAKARFVVFDYRNAALGRSLDRTENLYGVSTDYTIVPELKGVGEFRHQDVYYRKQGEIKNKSSDYFMGGLDYSVAKKVMITSRAGVESRRRAAEPDTTVPYAEFSFKYDYTESSFMTGGYAYTLDETSDTARFTDSKINRFFLNIQHAITPMITASGSIGWEPSQLQGRAGVADVDEDTSRFGFALSYLPQKNWSVSLTYDYDRVSSDDPARNMKRERVGVTGSYSF